MKSYYFNSAPKSQLAHKFYRVTNLKLDNSLPALFHKTKTIQGFTNKLANSLKIIRKKVCVTD